MNILKALGKTIGTAALVTTGTASAILKGVSDTVGFEIGSEVLGAAKDASFNGVRSIWSDKSLECMDKMDNLDFKVGDAARKQMARTAKQAAETRFFCMAAMTFDWLYSAILSIWAKRSFSLSRVCSP